VDLSQKEDAAPWNLSLAVQCLAEVRNCKPLSRPAVNLLKALCSLIDKPGAINFLSRQIIPHMGQIGANWPERELLADWLHHWQPRSDNIGWVNAAVFAEFVCSIGTDLEGVHRAILDYSQRSDVYKVLVPFTLARGWRNDSATLSLLLDWVVNEDVVNVRRAAFMTLANYFITDREVFELLIRQSNNDPSPHVRWLAIITLGASSLYPPVKKEIFLNLRHLAVHDPADTVRQAALLILPQFYPENNETLAILCDRAAKDGNPKVRFTTLESLLATFKDKPEVFEVLIDRALNDPEEWIRLHVISKLLENFRSIHKTVETVHEALKRENSEGLQQKLREMVEQSGILAS
jgi:hypothetical protein